MIYGLHASVIVFFVRFSTLIHVFILAQAAWAYKAMHDIGVCVYVTSPILDADQSL